MKITNCTLIILFIVSSVTLSAQEEEQEMKYIFSGQGKTRVSGFGGPIMGFSAIGDEVAFFMGGGGAVLLNQTFYIGAFGEGLTTRHFTEIAGNSIFPREGKIDFGYGGF